MVVLGLGYYRSIKVAAVTGALIQVYTGLLDFKNRNRCDDVSIFVMAVLFTICKGGRGWAHARSTFYGLLSEVFGMYAL